MLLFHILLRDADWISLFGGILVGLGLLAAARLTGEAIGYGDGLTGSGLRRGGGICADLLRFCPGSMPGGGLVCHPAPV